MYLKGLVAARSNQILHFDYLICRVLRYWSASNTKSCDSPPESMVLDREFQVFNVFKMLICAYILSEQLFEVPENTFHIGVVPIRHEMSVVSSNFKNLVFSHFGWDLLRIENLAAFWSFRAWTFFK